MAGFQLSINGRFGCPPTAPGDDCLGFDDDERPCHPRHTRERPDPEQAVRTRQSRPQRTGSREHVNLVTEREQLDVENGACAEAISSVSRSEMRTASIAKAYPRLGGNINGWNQNGVFRSHT